MLCNTTACALPTNEITWCYDTCLHTVAFVPKAKQDIGQAFVQALRQPVPALPTAGASRLERNGQWIPRPPWYSMEENLWKPMNNIWDHLQIPQTQQSIQAKEGFIRPPDERTFNHWGTCEDGGFCSAPGEGGGGGGGWCEAAQFCLDQIMMNSAPNDVKTTRGFDSLTWFGLLKAFFRQFYQSILH